MKRKIKKWNSLKILIGSQGRLKNKKMFKPSLEGQSKISFVTKQIKSSDLTEAIKVAVRVRKKILSFFSNIEIEVVSINSSVTQKKVIELLIEVKDTTLPILDKVVISKTSKMGEVGTFPLKAIETCRRTDKSDACKGCYAKKGNFLFPNVVARRERNLSILRQDNFVEEMTNLLFNDRFFRWFDSGDMGSITIIKKIIQVCQATPWVSHWVPTNTWDVPSLIPYIKELEALPNVTVRYSSRKYNTPILWNISSMIRTKEFTDSEVPEGALLCPAPNQGGTCKTCRACWDKEQKIIVYKKH